MFPNMSGVDIPNKAHNSNSDRWCHVISAVITVCRAKKLRLRLTLLIHAMLYYTYSVCRKFVVILKYSRNIFQHVWCCRTANKSSRNHHIIIQSFLSKLEGPEVYTNTEMKSGRLFTAATHHLTSAVVSPLKERKFRCDLIINEYK